jgi:hypothetical protein
MDHERVSTAHAAMEALLHWKLGSGTPSENEIQTAILA